MRLRSHKVCKALNKAVAQLLQNWDNPEAFEAIYTNALQLCRWGKPVTQGTLKLRVTTRPQTPPPHSAQLKLF